MITLYNVVSKDSFIAKSDGNEDFIPDSLWEQTLNVLKQYDLILLGRKTYETIQNYDEQMVKSFDNLSVRKVVVTKDTSFKVKQGYEITHSPEEIIKDDLNIVVTSGPTLNNYLLSKNLVQKVIYHKVPESLGEGIKPYDNLSNKILINKL